MAGRTLLLVLQDARSERNLREGRRHTRLNRPRHLRIQRATFQHRRRPPPPPPPRSRPPPPGAPRWPRARARAAPRARPPPRPSRARTQSASGCIARALLGARGLANAVLRKLGRPKPHVERARRCVLADEALGRLLPRRAVLPRQHGRARTRHVVGRRPVLVDALLRLGGAAQVVQRIVGLVAVDVVDRLAIHGRVVGTERAPHDLVHSFTLHGGVYVAARGPRRVPEGPALAARGFGLHAPARRHARAPIALRVELPPLAWHAEARVWRAELLPRQVALVLGRWAMPELVAASGGLFPFSGLQTSRMLPS